MVGLQPTMFIQILHRLINEAKGVLKTSIKLLILLAISNPILAITPAFNVVRKINFGGVMPDIGSCRMSASTGVMISYIGQFICILPDSAQNGRYTINANPNKIIRVKVLPNQNDGNGIIFNPYIELISNGFTKEVIYNNVGFKQMNTGADGIVELYMGGDLRVNSVLPYGQTINFNFVDAIEWYEDP
jgi:hypothetical protein